MSRRDRFDAEDREWIAKVLRGMCDRAVEAEGDAAQATGVYPVHARGVASGYAMAVDRIIEKIGHLGGLSHFEREMDEARLRAGK